MGSYKVHKAGRLHHVIEFVAVEDSLDVDWPVVAAAVAAAVAAVVIAFVMSFDVSVVRADAMIPPGNMLQSRKNELEQEPRDATQRRRN